MSGHMTPEEFRELGKQAVDWIADYRAGIESLPVRSQAEPGEVREQLPEHPPERGEDFQQALRDLDEVLLPGITQDWKSVV